jgi:hypothetical protein
MNEREDPMNKNKFYLGSRIDPSTGQPDGNPLLYDPIDLTTHAVVVGMTGSGKTGLCVGLMEEAALNGIPSLMIDPKGDITNTLLHFPDLASEDFQPWVNPDQARREGKSLEQAAVETASLWKEKLAEIGIGKERLTALQDAVEYAVYTPGSDAGIPVSILASFQAPPISWESNREMLREKISSTVTALLGLVGIKDVDPVRSREHILLANIFEHAWSQGRDLDLGELILQTQSPPFSKLGVFEVNTFFPEKDRFNLAMSLNNILAAPAFQVWIEGQPLDIHGLLYTPDGRPRHSVFYIAHLSDTERMFFVTLLFSAFESWMRTQAGSTTLRALLYFDEIYGYLPPVNNPSSKQPILRMLKQARAFGVGLVLVTQNPVDVDYKALSNAGTWFIGKLQTDQDKQRLLDGLQGAMAGDINRGVYDRLISTLGKRVFLLHNVHTPGSSGGPQLFRTRWAMNYLAGPLTRAQIPLLNQLKNVSRLPTTGKAYVYEEQPAGVETPVMTVPAAAPTPNADPAPVAAPSTRPAIPNGVKEYFLPNNLTFTQSFKAAGKTYPEQAYSQGLVYRPVLLAQASIRFLNRKYNLDYAVERAALVETPDRRGALRWDNYQAAPVQPGSLDNSPDPQASFAALEAPFTDARTIAAMERDYADWAYRTTEVVVRSNEVLKVYAGPEISHGEFRRMCDEAARQGRDAEVKKTEDAYTKRIEAIRVKLSREERELDEDRSRLSHRKMEEMGTHAENIFGLFGGRKRRLTTSLSKRRMTDQAKAAVEESVAAIEDYKRQMAALEKEKVEAVRLVQERWGELATQVTEIKVTPYKKDILMELFGVAWMPFHIINVNGELEELPGYEGKSS